MAPSNSTDTLPDGNPRDYLPLPEDQKSLTNALRERIEQICGRIPPPSKYHVWFPASLCDTEETYLPAASMPSFLVILSHWLRGERIIPGYAGKGYSRSNKIQMNRLRRAGLVIYDPIRDLVVLDERNTLNHLNRMFPEGTEIRRVGP